MIQRKAALCTLALLLVLQGCSSTSESSGTAAEAVSLYREAVEQDYSRSNDLDAAIEKMEEALTIEPSYAQLRRDLAWFYMKRGLDTVTENLHLKAQQATLEQRAANEDPAEARRLRQQAAGLQVTTQQLEKAIQEDLSKALHHFTVVRQVRPDDPSIPFFLGHVCAGLERYDDARDYYIEAMEMGGIEARGRKALRAAIEECERALATQDALED
jgi:Flp pilus assembly protein TadD